MTTTRHEELESNLGFAKAIGAITAFSNKNPTGNAIVWEIEGRRFGPDGAKSYEDPTETDTLELSTPEAEAFVAGIYAGRHGRLRHNVRKPSPIRDAIAAHGRVVVALADPEDKHEQKTIRNRIFAYAYTLGLKGDFRCKTIDGKVHGWRTDVDEDLAPDAVDG